MKITLIAPRCSRRPMDSLWKVRMSPPLAGAKGQTLEDRNANADPGSRRSGSASRGISTRS